MQREHTQQKVEQVAHTQKATFCQPIKQFEAACEDVKTLPERRSKQSVASANKHYWERHLKPMVTRQAHVLRERASETAIGYPQGPGASYDERTSAAPVIAWDEAACPRSTFKDVRHDERPREKLLERGADALGDAELLALMLDTGIKGMNVLEFAHSLLDRFGGLAGMQSLGVEELTCVSGLGVAKTARILAGFELSRRSNLQRRQQTRFANSAETAHYLRPIVADLGREVFYVLFMNTSNRVVAERKVSTGGLTATIVDPHVIFRTAFQVQATKLILCHNHPSGDLRPSNEDIEITQRMAKIGSVLGVELLDHLILASDGYYSFADHGGLLYAEPEPSRRGHKAQIH